MFRKGMFSNYNATGFKVKMFVPEDQSQKRFVITFWLWLKIYRMS